MFEDALMESGNRIKTRSKYWSLLTLGINGGAGVALIIWPLLHPQALPTQAMATLLIAPAPPPPPPPVVKQLQTRPTMMDTKLKAPSRIPQRITIESEPVVSQLSPLGVRGMEGLPAGIESSDMGQVMSSLGQGPAMTAGRAEKVRVSSGVMAGNLLSKIAPLYPAIAKAARIQGAVVLAAIISKNGSIQNLRVVSGPPMLRQAALDAVGSWHYKPYLLNGEAVEVETTVNVVFNLGN